MAKVESRRELVPRAEYPPRELEEKKMNGKKMTRNLFTAILSVSFVQLLAQGLPGGGGAPQLVISGAEVRFEPEALCAPFNGGLLGISGQNLGDGTVVPTVGRFRPLDPTPGEELLTVLDYNLALNPPLLVCLPTDIETTRGEFLLRVSVGTGPQNSDSALLSNGDSSKPFIGVSTWWGFWPLLSEGKPLGWQC